jgi:formate dehydrogenase major subunit
MTRNVPWLAELQPELFAEIDPELAVTLGIHNGEYVTINTAVGEIEARALVSGRMRPLRLRPSSGSGWQRVHQIGLPYNYSNTAGLAKGDSSGDLIPLSMDPNVSIHEAKTLTCNIRPGRRAARVSSAIDRDVPQNERSVEGQAVLHGRDSINE